jgi:hypothetical protein
MKTTRRITNSLALAIAVGGAIGSAAVIGPNPSPSTCYDEVRSACDVRAGTCDSPKSCITGYVQGSTYRVTSFTIGKQKCYTYTAAPLDCNTTYQNLIKIPNCRTNGNEGQCCYYDPATPPTESEGTNNSAIPVNPTSCT